MCRAAVPLGAVLLLAVLVLATGCAEADQYFYEPAPALWRPAFYASPQPRPRGTVQVVSGSVTEMQPLGEERTVPVLQVRLLLTNLADEVPWVLDTREVVVWLAGGPLCRPAFANADACTPPVLVVPRGSRQVVELYYPLPPSPDGRLAPTIHVAWLVQTGVGPLRQQTVVAANVPGL
jgi:hypothetical protein